MAKEKILKVTLVKSLIGRKPRHKLSAAGLGLSRINQTVTVEDTAAVRGMVNQISYLLKVEE